MSAKLLMQIPNTIQLSSVALFDRGRSSYDKVEELAESIRDVGLIQPLVLVPVEEPDGTITGYRVVAGGRRLYALRHLGVKELFHATTTDPERPGFILKGESDPMTDLFAEIAENLDRQNLDWRDEMKLVVKAWRMQQTKDAVEGRGGKGQGILMRDFGSMLGCGYADLQAATAIHDDVIANPERYKDAQGIRAAYSILLKVNENEVNRLLAQRSLQTIPLKTPTVRIQDEPEPIGDEKPEVVIQLSQAFRNVDGLAFMKELPDATFDHVVTDPDYAVAVARLESNMDTASGVKQGSIEESLVDLRTTVCEAWRVIKPQGFLVFWYDLDHHETLQRCATQVGFAVQRWPLIWVKTDYRSNAAPAHNFCKNIEYAMVCRKPGAVLSRAQMSSVFSCPTGEITRDLHHPFAKPLDLWKWIYSAVAIRGQTTFDPFFGSGSSSIAAAEWGLRPVGCEINPAHYYNAIMNLQGAYRKLLGHSVTFS